MVRSNITIEDEAGLHARPASELAKVAAGFKCEVSLFVGERKINAKSILNIMSAGIKKNTEIIVQCDGDDEQEALEEVMEILKSN